MPPKYLVAFDYSPSALRQRVAVSAGLVSQGGQKTGTDAGVNPCEGVHDPGHDKWVTMVLSGLTPAS